MLLQKRMLWLLRGTFDMYGTLAAFWELCVCQWKFCNLHGVILLTAGSVEGWF